MNNTDTHSRTISENISVLFRCFLSKIDIKKKNKQETHLKKRVNNHNNVHEYIFLFVYQGRRQPQ